MNNQKVIIMGAASHDFHNFTPYTRRGSPSEPTGLTKPSFPVPNKTIDSILEDSVEHI